MGIQGIARNTLANANKVRDWRIYADFTQAPIVEARRLYAQQAFGVELDQTAYALDSSTIDLCLSLFPWATFRKRKGAVKLHTLLDLRGNIPSLIIIANGKIHDVNILDELTLEAGAIYIVDRGYVDFERLYTISNPAAPTIDPRRYGASQLSTFVSPLLWPDEQRHARCPCGASHLPVQSRQRQTKPDSEFNIGGIIRCNAKASAQVQNRR